ncbi:unnamed protein product [Protopolystoma xenopodis]|uniref:Uncharacterized protein n=1 Tax=Protopolystoma xenopodis TaxID=117903 RepID=A0A3S5A849_9PLAT|nr:unnamed protein product [Protopolystoma xenopodis]
MMPKAQASLHDNTRICLPEFQDMESNNRKQSSPRPNVAFQTDASSIVVVVVICSSTNKTSAGYIPAYLDVIVAMFYSISIIVGDQLDLAKLTNGFDRASSRRNACR